MLVKSPRDIGLALRKRRRNLGMSQADLAGLIGVTRQWVIRSERGNTSAEIGLVLRALNALGLRLDVATGAERATPSIDAVDIDAILARTRGRRS
jgi:HTH-type transcriptional regulator/antitoxin HipB